MRVHQKQSETTKGREKGGDQLGYTLWGAEITPLQYKQVSAHYLSYSTLPTPNG